MRNDKKVHLGGFNQLDVGMLPPSSIDLEETVLGSIMTDKSAFAIVSTKLNSDDFYIDANSRIYNAISILTSKNRPIDFMSVISQLKSTDELEKVGGAYYVTKLTNLANASFEFHSGVIAEKSMLRKQISINQEFIRNCFQSDADPFELLAAQKSLLSNIEKFENEDFSPKTRMSETMEEIYKA